MESDCSECNIQCGDGPPCLECVKDKNRVLEQKVKEYDNATTFEGIVDSERIPTQCIHVKGHCNVLEDRLCATLIRKDGGTNIPVVFDHLIEKLNGKYLKIMFIISDPPKESEGEDICVYPNGVPNFPQHKLPKSHPNYKPEEPEKKSMLDILIEKGCNLCQGTGRFMGYPCSGHGEPWCIITKEPGKCPKKECDGEPIQMDLLGEPLCNEIYDCYFHDKEPEDPKEPYKDLLKEEIKTEKTRRNMILDEMDKEG